MDSILIDEARTPLIISGPTDDQSEVYRLVDALLPSLDPPHKTKVKKKVKKDGKIVEVEEEVQDKGDFELDENNGRSRSPKPATST